MGNLRDAALEMQQDEAEKQQAELGAPDFGEFFDDDEAGQETAASVIGVADISIVAVTFGTEFLARRKGEHWRLSDAEKQELEASIAKVAPDIALSPWWMLAATITGVFAPRIMQDMMLEEEAQKQIEKQAEKVANE